jgi:hypothetical protein
MKLIKFLIFISMIITVGCKKASVDHQIISESEQFITRVLNQEKNNPNFEIDSMFAYIKIGNFFNPEKQNAIVVIFDSIQVCKVFELVNEEWKLLFSDEVKELSRAFPIEAYIEDFNFDGEKDIALKNIVSNGTAIFSFHLWIKEKNSFIEIPEFYEIGNPMVVKNNQIIIGYWACCMFEEMSISHYKWENHHLKKIKQLDISDYPYMREAKLTDFEKKSTQNVPISNRKIKFYIDNFSTNWSLIDSTSKGSDPKINM